MEEEDRTKVLPSRRPAEAAASPAPVSVRPPAPAPETDQTIRFQAPPSAGFVQEADPVTGWLVVMRGPGRGRSLPLGYGLHSVGRGEDQRVSLAFGDKAISRRQHVVIAYDGEGRRFYVSPGTGMGLAHLNGQPILQALPVQAGDRVSLGKTEFALVTFCGPHFDWQDA